MNLTANMEFLLLAILAEENRLASGPNPSSPLVDRDARRAAYLERQEYRRYGIRYDLQRWLVRPPSRSDSVVFSRTLRRLDEAGLVVRVNRWGWSDRTTHVRLTPAGQAVAKRLLRRQEGALAELLGAVPLSLDGIAAAGTASDEAGNREDGRLPSKTRCPAGSPADRRDQGVRSRQEVMRN